MNGRPLALCASFAAFGAALLVSTAGCATALPPPPGEDESIFNLPEEEALAARLKPTEAPIDNGLGFIVPAADGAPERRFITLRPEPGEALPAVLYGPLRPGDNWKRLTLIDSAVAGYSWVYVGPVGTTRHVFAVLDSGLDELSPELVIVSSASGPMKLGVRGRLRKPDPRARLANVAMDVFGKGRISLRLDWHSDLEAKAGVYHFETDDGGRTFVGAGFEPE